MNILGKTIYAVEKAERWARANNATPMFVSLASYYWRYAPERGVVPEIAYAQAAKETGFGNFGGVIDESFCNPCGLKIAAGGDNKDPKAHQRFPNWHVGVIAHLDHLALYAGALGYPYVDTPDPRHFPSILGTAKTVEALGGKWAPSKTYGNEIVTFVKALRKA